MEFRSGPRKSPRATASNLLKYQGFADKTGMGSRLRISVAILVGVAALLLAVHGHRMVATNDEGIVLDAAERVSQGQRPYLDFWTYMTPGSYWLQGLIFRLFGVSLLTGRLVVIFDFSLQCALVFWLAAWLASLRAAAFVTIAFFGFQIADPTLLTAQHRWDSSTLALAGVAIALSATSAWAWVACGAVLAVAAWCTPTVGAVLCVVALWLAWQSQRRTSLVPLISGAGAVFAAGAAWLAATGELIPLISQMLWLRKNYLVNAMPYGAIIGGYRALFAGLEGAFDLAVRVVLVTCVALPALLPAVALLSWGLIFWRRKISKEQLPAAVLMLGAGAALILGLSPRPDVTHLAFVAALPYVLAGTALAAWIPKRARVPAGIGAALLAVVFASNSFNTLRSTSSVASPVGNLRVDNKQRLTMTKLFATVLPGQSLFVYPYMPMNYFLTQARNPTQFSFLSPGMSGQPEALAALAKLQANPPEWVLFAVFTREEYLRVVPEGASTQWRYEALENWIQKNYRPLEDGKVIVYGYELLQPAQPPQRSKLLPRSGTITFSP